MLTDELFSDRRPHLGWLWSYWLWKPFPPVCSFSHVSLHFFSKNFIACLRITLSVFSFLFSCLRSTLYVDLLRIFYLLGTHISVGGQEDDLSFTCVTLICRKYTGTCFIAESICLMKTIDTYWPDLFFLLWLIAHNYLTFTSEEVQTRLKALCK